MSRRRDPVAQLIADNICALNTSNGVMALTWLMGQPEICYDIGESIVALLRTNGYFNDGHSAVAAVEALAERWESVPSLRRGTAARELREALAAADD